MRIAVGLALHALVLHAGGGVNARTAEEGGIIELFGPFLRTRLHVLSELVNGLDEGGLL